MKNLALKPNWAKESGPSIPGVGVGAATVAQRRVLESELNKEGILIGQLPRSEPDWGEEVAHLEEGV